jgi:hypothetical protein
VLENKIMVVQVLYVDQLPEGYKDMAEFRKIFSQLVSPPYCQVAVSKDEGRFCL